MVNLNNYDEILALVEEIKRDDSMPMFKKISFYETKYPDFSERFPFILKKSCDPSFDFEFLKMMITKMKNVQTKDEDSKKDAVHNASVEVGQQLYDKFIKHKVDDME